MDKLVIRRILNALDDEPRHILIGITFDGEEEVVTESITILDALTDYDLFDVGDNLYQGAQGTGYEYYRFE